MHALKQLAAHRPSSIGTIASQKKPRSNGEVIALKAAYPPPDLTPEFQVELSDLETLNLVKMVSIDVYKQNLKNCHITYERKRKTEVEHTPVLWLVERILDFNRTIPRESTERVMELFCCSSNKYKRSLEKASECFDSNKTNESEEDELLFFERDDVCNLESGGSTKRHECNVAEAIELSNNIRRSNVRRRNEAFFDDFIVYKIFKEWIDWPHNKENTNYNISHGSYDLIHDTAQRLYSGAQDQFHLAKEIRKKIYGASEADSSTLDISLESLDSLKSSKPDRWFGFPIQTTVAKMKSGNLRFEFNELERLGEEGLWTTPFGKLSEAKSEESTKAWKYLCFPSVIVEVKKEYIKKREEEYLYVQIANATSLCAAILKQWAGDRFSEHEMPVVGITFHGSNVRLFITYCKPDWSAHCQCIWKGDLRDVLDAIQLRRILDTTHFWMIHILRPWILGHLNHWRKEKLGNLSVPVISNEPFGDSDYSNDEYPAVEAPSDTTGSSASTNSPYISADERHLDVSHSPGNTSNIEHLDISYLSANMNTMPIVPTAPIQNTNEIGTYGAHRAQENPAEQTRSYSMLTAEDQLVSDSAKLNPPNNPKQFLFPDHRDNFTASDDPFIVLGRTEANAQFDFADINPDSTQVSNLMTIPLKDAPEAKAHGKSDEIQSATSMVDLSAPSPSFKSIEQDIPTQSETDSDVAVDQTSGEMPSTKHLRSSHASRFTGNMPGQEGEGEEPRTKVTLFGRRRDPTRNTTPAIHRRSKSTNPAVGLGIDKNTLSSPGISFSPPTNHIHITTTTPDVNSTPESQTTGTSGRYLSSSGKFTSSNSSRTTSSSIFSSGSPTRRTRSGKIYNTP